MRGVDDFVGIPEILGVRNVQLACRGQAASLVIACAHNDTGDGGSIEEVEDAGERFVVCHDFVDLRDRVVGVAGMIDARALDHEEETLLAVLRRGAEGVDGEVGHFVKRRVNVVLLAAIDFIGDVGRGKKTKQRELHRAAGFERVEGFAIGDVGKLIVIGCHFDHIDIVRAAGARARVGQKVAAATAKHEVDDRAKRMVAYHLASNNVFFFPDVDVGGETGRCCVGDSRRHDQAGHVTRLLCGFQHSAAGRRIWQNRDGTVVALLPTGKRCSACRRVRHQARGAASARGADEVLVENKDIVHGETAFELAVASSEGETCGAHAIRDHEYEISLAGRFTPFPGASVVGSGLFMLIGYGEDDDNGGGDESPDEGSKLSPKGPAVFRLGRMGFGACEEGIFFFGVDFVGSFGGRAVVGE